MIRQLVIIALIVGGLILLLISCKKQQPLENYVSVLHDVTDSLLAQPEVNEIMAALQLNEVEKWNGITFRYSKLNEVTYNKQSEVRLNSTSKWLSNELDRKKEVELFKIKIRESITNEGMPLGRNYSSIYLSMNNELKFLSQKKGNRTLIIYSDLMENSMSISFYDPEILERMTNQPDLIKERLIGTNKLPNLDGISIYIIYEPENIHKDQTFRIVSNFYKEMLQEQGAAVYISANLTL